mmetsp:Transcript_11007/g.32031  ORF Transcript_11007/g.32031 Transcript_11007/m.32031 type:complete len:218 (+) Transcript_11007:401-1054(+)|eukprot:scaffold21249_cov32-Tisochrysis_lutea.AAC.2
MFLRTSPYSVVGEMVGVSAGLVLDVATQRTRHMLLRHFTFCLGIESAPCARRWMVYLLCFRRTIKISMVIGMASQESLECITCIRELLNGEVGESPSPATRGSPTTNEVAGAANCGNHSGTPFTDTTSPGVVFRPSVVMSRRKAYSRASWGSWLRDTTARCICSMPLGTTSGRRSPPGPRTSTESPAPIPGASKRRIACTRPGTEPFSQRGLAKSTA